MHKSALGGELRESFRVSQSVQVVIAISTVMALFPAPMEKRTGQEECTRTDPSEKHSTAEVRIPELPRLPERALPPVVQVRMILAIRGRGGRAHIALTSLFFEAQALPCSHPSRQPGPRGPNGCPQRSKERGAL